MPLWCSRSSPGSSPMPSRPLIALRYRIEIRGLDAVRASGRRGHPVPAEPRGAARPGVHRRLAVPGLRAAAARRRAPGRPDGVRLHRPAVRLAHPAEPGAQRSRAPATGRGGDAGHRRRAEGRREHPALPRGPPETAVPRGHRQRERHRDPRQGGARTSASSSSGRTASGAAASASAFDGEMPAIGSALARGASSTSC